MTDLGRLLRSDLSGGRSEPRWEISGLDRIGRAFNEEFSRWDICLPPVAIISKQSGRIVKRGWTVWYTFGSDEGTDYLDYYASHRMTNDRHTRLYADGRSEDLEVMHSGYVVPEDPKEAAQARANFLSRNRAARRKLDEKGFTLEGTVHPSVAVSHYLLIGGDGEQSEDEELSESEA